MVMYIREDLKCDNCEEALKLYKNFTYHSNNLVYSFIVDC